jgi:hypothetical protein
VLIGNGILPPSFVLPFDLVSAEVAAIGGPGPSDIAAVDRRPPRA